MGWLAVLAAVGIVCYAVSLIRHPWVKHRACNGTGRHSGMLYKNAYRLCTGCGGTGRRPRLGVRLFFRARRVWGETAPVEARERLRN